MLFSINDGQFYYEDMLILQKVNVTFQEGDRVGLIGENGSGKTTLLSVITKSQTLYGGELSIKRDLRIGYLKQNSGLISNNTVIEEMRLCFKELIQLEKRMREMELKMGEVEVNSCKYRQIASEYSEAKKKFEGLDGYNIDVKIKTVLNGLGFINLYDRVCSTFSGGEKTRLALAKLLLSEPELLILDEPTNHLDFSTLFWLEEYLTIFKGAILTVSHDRYFLDKVTDKIWEIEDKTIKVWRGNYTKSMELKEQWIQATKKEYDNQQVEIAKMQDYVNRNLVRATTAKSAQSRVKKLESLEIIENPIKKVKSPTFCFESEIEPTKKVIVVDNLTLYAGDKKLFENGSFTVLRNEKVAIVGENGAGKSTLLKFILASEKEYRKDVVFGKNLFISYYDQENLNLNMQNTVINEMWDKYPRSNLYEIRKSLGRMLFDEEDMNKKISSLSGGERAKLGFAVMMMKKSNFLIMDEPTNHIDLIAREQLEKALNEFEGTILFVSHDRYFLERVATKIVEIKNGINEYQCGFNQYLVEKEKEKTNSCDVVKKVVEKEQSVNFRSSKMRSEEVKRKNKLAQIEKDISDKEEEISSINNELNDPAAYVDYEKVKPKLEKIEILKKDLENLYNEWESLSEN